MHNYFHEWREVETLWRVTAFQRIALGIGMGEEKVGSRHFLFSNS